MSKEYLSIPDFLVNSLPDISNTECRELIRHIEIQAGASDIYVWLKQLRVAPYSFDFLDNGGRKSPEYIIENLPPLRINSHFLLAFHIYGFEENKYIAGRFCVPVITPVNRYMKDMFIEYRIEESGTNARLWCKVRGWFNCDITSRGFFYIFSVVNLIMTKRQLVKIKKLSEMLRSGKIRNRTVDFKNYYSESGLLWWVFCRRKKCNGLIT
jgi:hypothetical protein